MSLNNYSYRSNKSNLLSESNNLSTVNTSILPQTAGVIPSSTATILPKKSGVIKLDVPFTSQAPQGHWSDQRQEDGCEEAASLMAVYWARRQSLPTSTQVESELTAIADWETEHYGYFNDTSVEDTVKRIFNEYFKFDNAEAFSNVSIDKIINELENGNLVLVPANGRKLGNPFFTQPGPDRHMLLIIGYDYSTEEFITNDPGTRRGKDYRYVKNILYEAILNYPSGEHIPVTNPKAKAMIVVRK